MITAVRELITRLACQRLKVARLSPIFVPPPIPSAISDSRSTARVTFRSRSDGETWTRRVEDEGFRLAEIVDHAMEEADEERGVEAHRAGRVEEDDEAEGFRLPPSPGEFYRRPAMGDAAVDGPPEVETAAAAAKLGATDEPGAHRPCQPRGQGVGLCDLFGIDDMA